MPLDEWRQKMDKSMEKIDQRLSCWAICGNVKNQNGGRSSWINEDGKEEEEKGKIKVEEGED